MADRERSVWGWGDADRFPDADERRALARRLETELGFPERPLLEPTPLAEATIPASRIDPPAVLADGCTADREARARHTYGKGYPDLVRGFRGAFDPAPDLVAVPESEGDVADLLAWATDERVAVVPFGGGTSVVGGVEPTGDEGSMADSVGGGGRLGDGDEFAGVVSLDLRNLDGVRDVDEISRRARIGAGALGPEINDALADHDLQLRHYPQSYEFSTLGGWIATRAGGHFATVYTHIDDFVENVRAVTPAGTLETLDVPASGAGPDPNRFLLGSEGSFGVITEAWMRVQPRPPYRSRATVRFADFDEAVAATREIAQARLYPANCRLLDATEAMINELATDGSHLLVLGFEGLDAPVADDLERALAICADRGGRSPAGPTHEDRTGGDGGGAAGGERDREDTEGEWRSSFFEAPYLFNALVSVGVLVDTFETAVTWDRFPDLHAALQQEVTAAVREACGAGVLSCRFTHVYPDGPAPYYTLLAPAEPGRELEQWRAIKRTASDVLAAHDATITHHHAVGRVHREGYEREAPDAYLDALRSTKRTLDPAGIMNPGALLST
ncbi:FAD-binding oxidoreductase [Halovivax sp.]|uniref:FAD-binding oxidoreductase n=1 Tax=Halovivax sp. TaxID=1935978 RepID=UPI0025C47B1F|nr:FAD-binding oxidoreductase [Halovivax sp.]